jgi:hypothetical protein
MITSLSLPGTDGIVLNCKPTVFPKMTMVLPIGRLFLWIYLLSLKKLLPLASGGGVLQEGMFKVQLKMNFRRNNHFGTIGIYKDSIDKTSVLIKYLYWYPLVPGTRSNRARSLEPPLCVFVCTRTYERVVQLSCIAYILYQLSTTRPCGSVW